MQWLIAWLGVLLFLTILTTGSCSMFLFPKQELVRISYQERGALE